MDSPRMEKFEIDGDITSAGLRWKTYSKRFVNMLTAFGITNNAKKKALLLHYGGEQIFEVYSSFPENEVEDKSFEDILRMFDGYFNPKVNTEYQIYLFRQERQGHNEPIDKFCSRLRKLAMSCNFTDQVKEIKTQVIHNCTSQQLRRKALREEMSLEDILSAARSMEIADKHAAEMEHKDREQVEAINKHRELKCFKCGGQFPHNKEKRCPAIGKKCNNCGNMNHFSSVCKKPKRQVRAINDEHNDGNENKRESEDYMYGV